METAIGIVGLIHSDSIWHTYSDFSHGHMRQVERMFGPEAIGFTHDDGEAIEVLTFSNIHGVHAAATIMLAVEEKNQDVYDKLYDLAMELRRRFEAWTRTSDTGRRRIFFD